MEVKLENLIERIKSEGVEGAQKQAAEIIADAEKKAAEITAKAEKQAEEIIAKADISAKQFQQNSELAVRQAARDGELLFKSRIIALFDTVFKHEVKKTLQPEFLKEMILKVVESWKAGSKIEILANKADIEKLEALLFAGVKKELQQGIKIQASKSISGGFQIGLKDENVYYDYTDESIAEILKSFLNPRLNELLGKKNG